jgi:hypothetical protein
MITFKFEKPVLEVQLIDGTLENVIKTIHWRYSGINENGIIAETYGANSLPSPEAENFVEYEKLDNETIIGWLKSILDIDGMEENIANQIDLIENPKIEIRSID